VTVTGTSGSLKSTAALSLSEVAPSFTLSLSTGTLGINQGTSGTNKITVSPANGFTGAVALAASGLPNGVTASFSPSSTTGTSTLTLTAGASAALGAATVTITGTSGSLKVTTTLALTIAPPPNFTVSASPSSLTVYPGTSSASVVTVGAQNGFSGTVNVSASGMPSGVTTSFSVQPAGAVLLTFTASATAAAASSTVTIKAVSGSLSHTATISLVISAPNAGTLLVNPSSAYNVPGIYVDGSTFTTGGLDGGGRAYSANLLGSLQTISGTPFYLAPANGPDAISGKTVALPSGQYSTLKLLATGVNGNQASQKFTVTYTDGSSSSFTQSLSDWFSPQNYPGESTAMTMAYRDNSDGTRDSRPFVLYTYSFNLTAGKTVSSVVLPANRNVVVLALSLVKGATATPKAAPTQVNLSSAFDTTGITSDGRGFSGGLDGVGYAYSGKLLGATQSFNSTAFNLGPADALDVVSGGGKAITIPAMNVSSLMMLATGVNGNQISQTFKVTYTDGTTATFTQSLSDWYQSQRYTGESIAVTTAHRNTSTGASDNRPFYVYGYSFSLNNAKTVSSVILPNNPNVKVLALTLVP